MARKEFLLSSLNNNLEKNIFFLLLIFLSTQLGKHFWPSFSFVNGIRVDYLSPTVYFTDILIIFLFVIFLIKLNAEDKKRFARTASDKKTLLAILMLILSVIFSTSPLAGTYGLIKVFEFAFLVFFVYRRYKKYEELLPLALAIGIVFQSILSFVQFMSRGSVNGILYYLGERFFTSSTPGIANASINGELILRPYGTFPHPNVLAGFILISLLIILLSMDKIKKYKKVFLFTFIIGSISLFLTMSRTAIIAWAIFLPFTLVLKRPQLNKNLKIILVLQIPILMFFSYFFLFNRISELSFYNEAVLERLNLAKAAFEMFVSNPLLGVGLNNFIVILPEYYKSSNALFFLQPVHNIYLLTLGQCGVIIFILTLYWLVKIIKTKPFTPLLVVLFVGLFDHYFLTLQQGQIIFSIVIGIALHNASFKALR